MKRRSKGVRGEETLKACFKATDTALKMLEASIRNENLGKRQENVGRCRDEKASGKLVWIKRRPCNG